MCLKAETQHSLYLPLFSVFFSLQETGRKGWMFSKVSLSFPSSFRFFWLEIRRLSSSFPPSPDEVGEGGRGEKGRNPNLGWRKYEKKKFFFFFFAKQERGKGGVSERKCIG